jgi:predicted dithiol-disulfide oxidoreductase (DUF899 family)
LLTKEKELTRRRHALNAERRRLPMVKIDKDCQFEGPGGRASLLDLFDGRRQLIVRHFMFHPSWDEGCSSCSAGADEICDGPYESVAPVEYNYRTKEEHEQAGTSFYVEGEQSSEGPGQSCFLRDGETVYHTYSSYARGAEMVGGATYYLDLTALGRQEDREEPRGRAEAARGAIPDFST